MVNRPSCSVGEYHVMMQDNNNMIIMLLLQHPADINTRDMQQDIR